MKTILPVLCFLVAQSAFSQIVTNDFDENTGTNYYSSLTSSNWVNAGDSLNIAEHAGTHFFATANGNSSGTFTSIGITKELGGVIEDHPYTVSFYIAVYNDGTKPIVGVEYADFLELKIGGPNGTTVWDSVPTPTIYGEWIEWTGTYTPDASDLGQQFEFVALFDLDWYHSVAFDGPFTMYDPAIVSLEEHSNTAKELVGVYDMMGRETNDQPNTFLLYVYSDGTTEKVFRFE